MNVRLPDKFDERILAMTQNKILRYWWHRLAVDWDIPFWMGLENTPWTRTLGGQFIGEAHPFCKLIWNIGISFRLSTLQPLLSKSSRSVAEVFLHLPHWLNTHLPISLTPPHTCTSPIPFLSVTLTISQPSVKVECWYFTALNTIIPLHRANYVQNSLKATATSSPRSFSVINNSDPSPEIGTCSPSKLFAPIIGCPIGKRIILLSD